jgi:hypothetical protein
MMLQCNGDILLIDLTDLLAAPPRSRPTHCRHSTKQFYSLFLRYSHSRATSFVLPREFGQ